MRNKLVLFVLILVLFATVSCGESALPNTDKAIENLGEGYEKASETKIVPKYYENANGEEFVFYQCHTKFYKEIPATKNEVDETAVSGVIDLSSVDDMKSCRVGDYAAVLCKKGKDSFLCWTWDPTISFVIKFDADVISEDAVLETAKNVKEE